MGLKFCTFVRFPFFGMGTTKAFFQLSGNWAVLMERLYMKVTSGFSVSKAVLIAQLLMCSKPEDLEIFILLMTLCTSHSETSVIEHWDESSITSLGTCLAGELVSVSFFVLGLPTLIK